MFYNRFGWLAAMSAFLLTISGTVVANEQANRNASASAPAIEKKYSDEQYLEKEFKRGRMAFLFGEYDTASNIMLPLANHGYAKAQAIVAWMYHIGKGRPKDLHKAFDWYVKAAKQNEPIAQNNLGVFYEQGLAVKQSYGDAAKWYRESAEWGYRYAQYNLGMLYYTGHGVAKDPDQAQFWLQIAALQGVSQAIDTLKNIAKSVHKNNVVPSDSLSGTPTSPTWQRHSDKEKPPSGYHHPNIGGK